MQSREGGDETFTSVELTLKDAPPCCSSCVKTERLSPKDVDFTDSNPDEVQRLLKKYAVKRDTVDRTSIVLQQKKQGLSFNQLRKFRAEHEKVREARSLEGDSDDESACALCSDDESSCGTPVATMLELSDSESDGFSSDDSES